MCTKVISGQDLEKICSFQGGIYWFTLMNEYCGTFALFAIALFEVVLIGQLYGEDYSLFLTLLQRNMRNAEYITRFPVSIRSVYCTWWKLTTNLKSTVRKGFFSRRNNGKSKINIRNSSNFRRERVPERPSMDDGRANLHIWQANRRFGYCHPLQLGIHRSDCSTGNEYGY